jgi:hypothetical protein
MAVVMIMKKGEEIFFCLEINYLHQNVQNPTVNLESFQTRKNCIYRNQNQEYVLCIERSGNMILVASLGHIFSHYVVKSILSVLCAFITSVGFAMEILICFLSATTTKHCSI